jgi:ribosome maturation factor RimP
MKIKKFGTTEQKVFELTQPVASELGVDIWDIRLEKEGALWYLRVFIDKEEGISIDDCEALSQPLNKILDDADPIPQSYILEVGSAGLERELLREGHFELSCGKDVRVHLIRPMNETKDFIGILESFSKDSIAVNSGDSEIEIMFKDISYVRLYEEF